MLAVVKTNVTANHMPKERVEHRLNAIEQDYIYSRLGLDPVVKIVIDANKAVCTEFGLAMFLGDRSKGTVLKRVPVVDFVVR